MTRIDEKIAREYSAQHKVAKKLRHKEAIASLRNDAKHTLVSMCKTVSAPIISHIDSKKRLSEEAKSVRERYEQYIAMHNDSQVGSIHYIRLGNGGIECRIHTEHGIIIKKVEHAKDKIIQPRNITNSEKDGGNKPFEHQMFYKVTYEGFCLDSNSKKYLDHYYYACATCENVEGIMRDQIVRRHLFSGIIRSDSGKFKKLSTENLDWGHAPESHPVFHDLVNTFETAYCKHYGLDLEK